MSGRKIQFTPEMALPPEAVPAQVSVKGRLPRLDYSFSMKDVYPTIPSLNPRRAYAEIAKELDRVRMLLSDRLPGARSADLPRAENELQASHFLAVLFDSTRCHGCDPGDLVFAGGTPMELFRLREARPFAFRLASPAKIAHTMAWIDTNVKIAVEDVAVACKLPFEAVGRIVEAVFRIYSLIVKQQDFRLARAMNFNYSMFLQDRILSLVLGRDVPAGGGSSGACAMQANDMALQLLKGFRGLSYQQLCTLSVFMGVMWVSSAELQQGYVAGPDNVLGDMESQIKSMNAKWSLNHVDRFLKEIAGFLGPARLAVILDDNGESVFDMALFQRLLDDTAHLRVGFIVNEYPVSNNMALDTFRALLQDPYFSSLRNYLAGGRATLCVESQMFRSFEPEYLRPATREFLEQAAITYVKGANFFETFQPTGNVRYYCFTVHGWTSSLLTGCPEGAGVFVRIGKGAAGYTYESPGHMVTLVEKAACDKEGVERGG